MENIVDYILKKMNKNNYIPQDINLFKYGLNILFKILYLIFNYPHKHYTFKHFEV